MTNELLTAIVTPFTPDDRIDFPALEQLTNHLMATGTQGFVIGGTTGEAPTLSHDEKIELYTRFAQMVHGRGMVIAGTGSNNTQETTAFTAEVSQIPGIDLCLVVVPYYNKPNQRGMMAHFTTVADASQVPIVIYNIPGRTGVTMSKETVVELAQHPNIGGVKQCTTIQDLAFIAAHAPAGFHVWTGEDAQALAAIASGAEGVISVAAHVYGQEMSELFAALHRGDLTTVARRHQFLLPRMAALFMYPSPAPVKAILNATGWPVGGTRLPILPLDTAETQALERALDVTDLSAVTVTVTN